MLKAGIIVKFVDYVTTRQWLILIKLKKNEEQMKCVFPEVIVGNLLQGITQMIAAIPVNGILKLPSTRPLFSSFIDILLHFNLWCCFFHLSTPFLHSLNLMHIFPGYISILPNHTLTECISEAIGPPCLACF